MGKRGPKKGEGGRPRMFDDEKALGMIEAYASLGLPVRSICHLMGIPESTFYRNIGKTQKLMQAFERGLAKGVSEAALHLKDLVEAKDLAAIKFYLTHVAKWHEKQQVEVTHKGGLTPEAVQTIRQSILGLEPTK